MIRDGLTGLAILLIVVLGLALAVPPLLDWREHRAWVDDAMARAAGTAVRTDGALQLRLLPTPRLEAERFRFGGAAATVTLDDVAIELALTPLLHGEFRVLGARVGRADLALSAGAGGAGRVPRSLVDTIERRRAWAFDDVAIDRLAVTTGDAATGRTDQAELTAVKLQAPSSAGPWRLSARWSGVPFEVATGEIGSDLATTIKVVAGEGRGPRGSFDGRLAFSVGSPTELVPRLTGDLKLSAFPAAVGGDAVPAWATLQASVTTDTGGVSAETVAIEAGPVRLTGTGRFDGNARRLALDLGTRRIDLDALLTSAGAAGVALPARVPVPVDLSLRADALKSGDDEVTGLVARARIVGDRAEGASLDATAPGGASVRLSGNLAWQPAASADGRVTVSAREGRRFATFLAAHGLGPPVDALLTDGELSASADFAIAPGLAAFSGATLRQGDVLVTGALRFTAPEAARRARVDAQLALRGLDAADLGTVRAQLGRDVDLGLLIDAREVRYGGRGAGRIAANLSAERGVLEIARLEISDLAGASATLSGRLAPGEVGHVTGRVTAPRAAPLVDVLGRPWLGALSDLVPAALRDAPLDLSVVAEAGGAGDGKAPSIRTVLKGSAARGTLDAEVVTRGGVPDRVTVTAATDRVANWLGTTVGSPSPARLSIIGQRDGTGRLLVRLDGGGAGLGVETRRPFALSERDGLPASGEASLRADDAGAVLAALQPSLGQGGAVPLALDAEVTAQGERTRVALAGTVAGTPLEATLVGSSLSDITGRVSLRRVSLPWLASALALNGGRGTGPGWSTERFGAFPAAPFGFTLGIVAQALELGTFTGENSTFELATVPDGFALRDLNATVGGGVLTGEMSLVRQGGLAVLSGRGQIARARLAEVAGAPLETGRVTADLRFGASAESVAGLVANLGGAGRLAVDDVSLPGVDPAGIDRGAARALRGDDPLSEAKLAALVAEEAGRGAFGPGRAEAPLTVVGGVFRASPIVIATPPGSWQGAFGYDLKSRTLDLRGTLQSRGAPPRDWAGPPPAVSIGWSGPLGRARRTLDVGPLVSGLAAVVLSRELDRIDTFERDASERQRLNSRTEMDRARKADEARAQAEEQARLRAEAEERQRAEAVRSGLGADGAPLVPPPRPPPALRAPATGG